MPLLEADHREKSQTWIFHLKFDTNIENIQRKWENYEHMNNWQ